MATQALAEPIQAWVSSLPSPATTKDLFHPIYSSKPLRDLSIHISGIEAARVVEALGSARVPASNFHQSEAASCIAHCRSLLRAPLGQG